jgi:hypothetical protein
MEGGRRCHKIITGYSRRCRFRAIDTHEFRGLLLESMPMNARGLWMQVESLPRSFFFKPVSSSTVRPYVVRNWTSVCHSYFEFILLQAILEQKVSLALQRMLDTTPQPFSPRKVCSVAK